MANKKTSSSKKKISQKVQKIVQTDVFKSVAIASVLLNILFFVTIIVFTSTNTFDRKLYLSAQDRYCDNIDGVKDRAEQLGSTQAAEQEWQIDCIGKQFKPFYSEALDKFRASSNQN